MSDKQSSAEAAATVRVLNHAPDSDLCRMSPLTSTVAERASMSVMFPSGFMYYWCAKYWPMYVRPMQAAVDAYGSQDADLWMKYVQSRLKRGKSVGDVYWRASRTLHDPAVFMLKYEALQLAEEMDAQCA